MRPLVLLIAAALLMPSAAHGVPASCSKRTDVLSRLADKFSEATIAIGLASNGALVEVLSSENGTTWTILLTTPNGVSCLVATGEAWQPLVEITSNDPEV